MKLTEPQLQQLIEDIEKRFDGPDGLFDVMETREKHFFRHPEANPQLAPPFKSSYQTDIPRRKHQELKARLTERAPVIHAFAHPDTAKQRQKANNVEQLFQTGIEIVEKRAGIDIAGALADGQIIQGYGMLHWLKADHIWPAVPENEWMEGEPPEDEPVEDYERLNLGDQMEVAKYRKSAKGLLKQRVTDTARAGFPWYIEVPHPRSVLWVEDRSLTDGYAWVLVRREIGLMDYISRAADTNGNPVLSMNEVNSELAVYGERDAPADWTPNAEEWGERVTLYCLWGRNHYYEIVCGKDKRSQFHVVQNGVPHPYEKPPFVMCPAQIINVENPVYRFLPALAGVFAVKPHYDRHMAILLALAEQNALPFYYMKRVSDGEPLLAEDGTTLIMTRDAAFSQKIPDGYEIVAVGPEQINPAFVSLAEWWKSEMDEAMPPTGQAEFTSSAQPWTVRLQQTQANVEPGLLLSHIANAMEVMIQNMAMVMGKPAEDGGFGETMSSFTKTKDGRLDRSKTVSVEPEDFDSIDIGVDINKVSGAEQVSKEQHGMEMLTSGLITPEDFYENYMGLPDAEEYRAKLEAEKLTQQYVLPGLGQMMQQMYGALVGLGPNGQFINGMGQPVSPEQVAQQVNGMQPQGAMQTSMPGMAGLSAPGTMPLGGLPG